MFVTRMIPKPNQLLEQGAPVARQADKFRCHIGYDPRWRAGRARSFHFAYKQNYSGVFEIFKAKDISAARLLIGYLLASDT
jgi:hypothetical protein